MGPEGLTTEKFVDWGAGGGKARQNNCLHELKTYILLEEKKSNPKGGVESRDFEMEEQINF